MRYWLVHHLPRPVPDIYALLNTVILMLRG